MKVTQAEPFHFATVEPLAVDPLKIAELRDHLLDSVGESESTDAETEDSDTQAGLLRLKDYLKKRKSKMLHNKNRKLECYLELDLMEQRLSELGQFFDKKA